MLDWRSPRNALSATVLAGITARGYQAVGGPGSNAEEAWSFDMRCLEMRLYPAKRCDAHLPEDVKDDGAYRAEVAKYREEPQSKDKRDSEILNRLNRDLPGTSVRKVSGTDDRFIELCQTNPCVPTTAAKTATSDKRSRN